MSVRVRRPVATDQADFEYTGVPGATGAERRADQSDRGANR